jgi:hypothetical protein
MDHMQNRSRTATPGWWSTGSKRTREVATRPRHAAPPPAATVPCPPAIRVTIEIPSWAGLAAIIDRWWYRFLFFYGVGLGAWDFATGRTKCS